MGAAASTNSTKLIVKALTNVSTEIVRNSQVGQTQSIIISVQDAENVDINNLESYQNIHIDIEQLFKAYSTEENQAKINDQIAQKASELLSGLNFGQIGVSTNLLKNITENCIEIKNKSIETCLLNTSQSFILKIKKAKNVTVNGLHIKQIADVVFACLSDTSQETTLKLQTDKKIDQVASAKLEGLDAKWIMIALAVGGVGITTVGMSSIKPLIGPIISMCGVGLCVFQYIKGEKASTITTTAFLNNDLEKIYTSLVVTKKIRNVSKDSNFGDYGEADLYSYFNKTVTLYRGDIDLSSIKSNFTEHEISTSLNNEDHLPNGTGIEEFMIDFKNEMYSPIIVNAVSRIKSTHLLQEIPKALDKFKNGDIIVELKNIFMGRIRVYQMVGDKPHLLETFDLDPMVIAKKTKADPKELIKHPLFICGVGVTILGILTMLLINHV